MIPSESLEDFYKHKNQVLPANCGQDFTHFNVFRREDIIDNAVVPPPVRYARRDFYKISLIRGEHIFHFGNKSIKTSGNNLMFFHPQIPYRWEACGDDNSTGYFCIFKESFFTDYMRSNIRELPMFKTINKPLYSLDSGQHEQIVALFEKILAEMNSDYRYKFDLIQNYVTEFFHFALKMEPTETLYPQADANSRITAVFKELLDRQFPIESHAQQFAMRSAKDFSTQLSVHVNHLNRAIKETTGKTTTYHITQKIISEARDLLKYTDWTIAEISYCLGFEEQAHFNNFFRKNQLLSPTAYRISLAS